MKTKTLALIPVVMLFSGCTMAPKYEQPPMPVEAGYAGAPAGAAAARDIAWQDFFGDPRLKTLIGLTLENNRDLREMTLAEMDLWWNEAKQKGL